MIEQVVVLGTLAICMRAAWQTGQKLDLKKWTEYLSMEPNAYRLWDQLLLSLDRKPYSLITLYTLSWGASMVVTYLLLMPTDLALVVFLAGVLAVSLNFSVRSALMYPLLALLVVTGNPLILVPLALVKEHGLWVGTGALLLKVGLEPMLLLCVAAAFLVFLSLRFFIKAEWSDTGAPQFTPRYVFNILLGRNPEVNRWLVLWNSGGLVVMVIFGLFVNWPLLLWGAAPVLLMGCFWEPQLWLPMIIAILGG